MNPGKAHALVAAATVSLAAVACVSPPSRGCTHGQYPALQDTLYFGTSMPQGLVTADEWARFLQNTVTPRFPQGLTVSQASGQWRGADGSIVQESTRVLQLVHPDDSASESAIGAIVASYKAAFHQESVLRVTSSACASF